jgi:hypothetical protein
MGQDPKAPLKYGLITGESRGRSIDVTDAQAIYAASGRFAVRNATTGYAEIAQASSAHIIGWLEGPGGDNTSTSNVKCKLLRNPSNVYRIPLAYDGTTYTVNYSKALKYENCDLLLSTRQYGNPTVVTKGHLIIVGGKAATGTTLCVTDGYLDVIIHPSLFLDLGVGE